MVDIDKIDKNEKRMYTNGILRGKLHPLHAGKSFLKELDVSKHVSVCFYLSEKDFIDGLVNYNSELYTGELRRISEQKDGIGNIDNFSDMKIVDKLEE